MDKLTVEQTTSDISPKKGKFSFRQFTAFIKPIRDQHEKSTISPSNTVVGSYVVNWDRKVSKTNIVISANATLTKPRL